MDYDHKDMEDTGGIVGSVNESQKSIDALTLKGSDKRTTSLANLPGSLNTSIGYTIGHLGLENAYAKTTDAAGLHSGGNYTKLTLNATQSQYLIEDTTLQTTLKAQKASDITLTVLKTSRSEEPTESEPMKTVNSAETKDTHSHSI